MREGRVSLGGARAAGRATSARRRDLLVVVLTLTTGALDGVTYLRLGHVFSSVITGNLVLIGVAAGRQYPALALNGGLALAGYAAGLLAGGRLAGTPEEGQPAWPGRVTVALAAEFLLLVAFTVIWYASGGHPVSAARFALLLIAAGALGMQSAAVRRLGSMSTTYLTSTLAGLLTALAIRRWPAQWQRSTGVLVAIMAGAALGAVAATQSPAWVPAAILVPLVTVIASAMAG